MKKLLFVLPLFLLVFSCKKDGELPPDFSGPLPLFFAKGVLKAPGEPIEFPFEYVTDKKALFDEYPTVHCYAPAPPETNDKFIIGSLGHFYGAQKLFALQFEPLDASTDWSKAELENLFTPGREFSFGYGPEQFQLRLMNPLVEYNEYFSNPDLNADNRLRVVEREDFEWTESGVTRRGLRVRFAVDECVLTYKFPFAEQNYTTTGVDAVLFFSW